MNVAKESLEVLKGYRKTCGLEINEADTPAGKAVTNGLNEGLKLGVDYAIMVLEGNMKLEKKWK